MTTYTITKKIGIISGLTAIILGVIGFVSFYLFDVESVPTMIVIALVLIILAVSSVLTYFYISNPLYKITREMKALLTNKPYKKIFTPRIDEMGVIANFFNEITSSLERATAEVKERRKLSHEINTAAQIQQDLLPKEKPQIPGLDITAKTRAAAEIGGDSYDFISLKDHSIIYLGDVTGHGIPSGLVMMMVNTLIHSFANFNLDSKEILIQTNTQLKPRIKKAMFMSMILMKWHHAEQKMIYSGAGHEYLIIYRAATGEVEKIPSGGIALGMIPNNAALTKNNELPLNAGDIIVLYSDGVTEGRNPQGEMFTEAGIIAALKEVTDKSADEIHNHIARSFTDFFAGVPQADDITLMVIKRIDKK